MKRAIEGLRSLAGDKVMFGTRYDKVMNVLDTMELVETGKCEDRCEEVRKFIKELTGRTEVLGGRRDTVVISKIPTLFSNLLFLCMSSHLRSWRSGMIHM